MLVGACIAGPPKVRGQILGSAGTANAGRASPAPTVKSRNSAYNYTHLSRFIVGVGLCSTRRAFPPRITQKKTRKRNRSQVLLLGTPSAGAFRKQCSALFLATGPREANASRIAAQREAVPSVKSRNNAYNHTRTLRPIVGVGLCSTRGALRDHTALAGEQCSPLRDEIAKAHIYFTQA